MTVRWSQLRGIAAILTMALLGVGLLGCRPQGTPSDQDVAGARVGQALPNATGVAKTVAPAATATPGTAATNPTTGRTTTPAPTPPTPTPIPESIAKALADVYSNVDFFQAMVSITANPGTRDASSMIVRQLFKKPGMFKAEVVKADANLAAVGTVLLFDGRTLTLYDPQEDQILRIQEPGNLNLFLNLPQPRLQPLLQVLQADQFLSTLGTQAIVSVGGTERVAKREATLVDLVPKAPTQRFHHVRMWLDRRTRVPLRTEAFGSGGAVLMRIEYTQFDPTTEISNEIFNFPRPTTTKEVGATPDQIAALAGLEQISLQEARTKIALSIFLPAGLPAGTSVKSLWTGNYRDTPILALLYGGNQGISAALIERPATTRLPNLRGAEPVNLDGSAYELYQSLGIAVLDWTREGTHLTLATTLPRSEALDVARSVR